MTPPLTDDRPRSEYTIGPSVKNPFDRDPLIIPQLFVDGKPWYRRRDTIGKLMLAIVSAILLTLVVRHYTAETVLRGIARLGPR